MNGIPREKLTSGNYLTFVIGAAGSGTPVEAEFKELAPEDYVGPLYHPGVEDEHAWRPGNELASEYTAVQVLWTNFSTLFEKAKREPEAYARKLLLKAAAVELKSLLDALPRFNALLAKLPLCEGPPPRTMLGLFEEERLALNVKSKALNAAIRKVEKDLLQLRNHVGAHMSKPLLRGAAQASPGGKGARVSEPQPWAALQTHWDRLEPRFFFDVALAFEKWLVKVQYLPLFEFYRIEPSGDLRCHVPSIVEERPNELHFTAISPTMAKQISEFDGGLLSGGNIVFRREPLRLKIGWPPETLKQYPWLADHVIEVDDLWPAELPR